VCSSDLYVANDGDANHLWLNDHGKFVESALLKSAAYNEMGQAEAGMGIAIGDYDDDGDEDLFLTHLRGETNTLYNNNGKAIFSDQTLNDGLSAPSRQFTAFGVGFQDFDHDGDLDVFIANGDVRANDLDVEGVFPYEQPNQLMINQGGGKFTDQSEQAGDAITRARVSRSTAFGDIDLDGDIDILLTNDNGPVELLINAMPKAGNWASIRVMESATNRDAFGAIVRAKLSNGITISRTVRADGSYFASSDPRVHLTWPKGVTVERITVSHHLQTVVEHDGIESGDRLTLTIRND